MHRPMVLVIAFSSLIWNDPLHADPAVPGLTEKETVPLLGDIEGRILIGLREGNPEDFQVAARKIAALKPAELRALDVRVRGDLVEFRFRGEYPADRISPGMLEYVVSNAVKDYESLLVVNEAELRRARRLGDVLAKMRTHARHPKLEVKFAWVEDGQPHVEDLRDILHREPAARRDDFLQQLQLKKDFGLEAFNAEADPSRLPTRRVAGMVIISVQLPPAKPGK